MRCERELEVNDIHAGRNLKDTRTRGYFYAANESPLQAASGWYIGLTIIEIFTEARLDLLVIANVFILLMGR